MNVKTLKVARAGLDKGMKTRAKMPNGVQPSMRAASLEASETRLGRCGSCLR